MELKLSEAYEKTLDEIDSLEFQLEEYNNYYQRLSHATEIIKKHYLLQILKIMLAIENELTGDDCDEFRSLIKELSLKVNSIARDIKEGNRLYCEDLVLDIIEKFILYLKSSIKNIKIYRKSRQIQIVV